MESLIKLENVSKNFGMIQALQSIDFEIYPGEIVGLVGDNGAGKSTLIKIIAGIFPPSSGNIYFEGKKLTSYNPHISREFGIQAVHQGVGLVDTMSVERNMVLGEEPVRSVFFLNMHKIRKITKEMLGEIDIKGDFKSWTLVGELSGGQKQAIKIGRSISYKERLLLLDEPVTGLSVRETYNVLELIKRLKEKKVAVIFITHDVHQVYPIADRIVILERGKKILDIPKCDKEPEEIVNIIRNPGILECSNSATNNQR